MEYVPSLSEEYRFADPASIASVEVAQLLRQVEMGRHVENTYLETRGLILPDEGSGFINVGVRYRDASLVGFGSVAYTGTEGELCDFVVSPSHQGRGIGRAIIAERLRQTEAAGITALYIPNLEPTNTLKSYYLEHGFAMTAAGLLVRGYSALELRQALIGR